LVLLQNTLSEIKELLRPVETHTAAGAISEETLKKFNQNNLFLKELNLKLSEKLLALERNYESKLNDKLSSLENEKSLWLKEQTLSFDGKLSQLEQKQIEEIEFIKRASIQ
jgi:hypothetical protein